MQWGNNFNKESRCCRDLILALIGRERESKVPKAVQFEYQSCLDDLKSTDKNRRLRLLREVSVNHSARLSR